MGRVTVTLTRIFGRQPLRSGPAALAGYALSVCR